jgi:hypothetical protein
MEHPRSSSPLPSGGRLGAPLPSAPIGAEHGVFRKHPRNTSGCAMIKKDILRDSMHFLIKENIPVEAGNRRFSPQLALLAFATHKAPPQRQSTHTQLSSQVRSSG